MTLRACKLLNCTPWELASQPNGSYWRDWALVCERADNLIEEALTARAKRNAERRRKN